MSKFVDVVVRTTDVTCYRVEVGDDFDPDVDDVDDVEEFPMMWNDIKEYTITSISPVEEESK